ncbi:MAG: response regulator [Chitinophagaceae bacterium]|nr:response regulator [Chitinophagaceae bacterium]
MNHKGPIIIIEDDFDDQQMLKEIFAELQVDNELLLLPDGASALRYLEQPSVKPFLVISDINLPRMSGFEVRAKIDQHPEIRIRCVPYVFLSTASSKDTICDAYALSVQGFFTKPNNFKDLKETIRCILHYWQVGKAPNNS